MPVRTEPPAGPTVAVRALSKSYGKARALHEVTFEARAGQAVALWGPNGAGKTTLIKSILGLIEFEGEIRVAGVDARRDGKRARRHIGYVPQEAVFYDQSAQATMEFYARLKHVERQRIAPLLARLGLAEHAQKPVAALSGGLKQRLALAVALLADPPVLLLDEPTANLDNASRGEYLQLLAGLRKEGKTILFASHRLEDLERLADRVLLLEGGRVLEDVPARALALRLAPEVELTLWVPDEHRARSVDYLTAAGLTARLNGHGTVIVRVANGAKMHPLEVLRAGGVAVNDFALEPIHKWK